MEIRKKNLNIYKELIIEIAGKGGSLPEKKVVREAILAVIYYIKSDLRKEVVSADEFSEMLEAVLEGFGYHVKAIVKNGDDESKQRFKTVSVNLPEIASEGSNCYELFFFDSLAKKLRESLGKNPNLLCINGLQECVKKIVGVSRWDRRCKNLSEEIVCFARSQFEAHSNNKPTALLIK